ncbi:hypothetical protein NKR19_g9447 [Coniochaeta hoffmannii]|uniref:Uncharacterized protein n=1 Tax=Coniochaeta hoffmannii TaxID=91930 RepID=A0AA38RJ80_9PEZI|nr:hypothetical protein NKR19_g9447 [Coniochaeta hoffmannii]
MPRPAKRARVDEAQSAVYAHQEEDEEHDDYPEDEEDDEDDMGDDDPDADGDPDTDGDREAQALVQALGDGADQQGGGGGGGAPEKQKHENIVDYCYRMGYFPASERFPSAVTAGRFRSAPLRPQRTLDKNPLTRRSWHPKKPANWCAVLLQCGGQEVSDACTRCAEDQGMWTQCVVPNDWATSWITRGACANCYMDGKRAMAVSPSARAKAAAAQPAATSSPELSSSAAVASTTAAPFTSAGFAPSVGATPSTNRRQGRPSVPAAHSEAAASSLSNQDFEGLKRQYNRLSTSELDKLAERSAAERARISLQLAAIDAVRAAREAFANRPPNGTHPT